MKKLLGVIIFMMVGVFSMTTSAQIIIRVHESPHIFLPGLVTQQQIADALEECESIINRVGQRPRERIHMCVATDTSRGVHVHPGSPLLRVVEPR